MIQVNFKNPKFLRMMLGLAIVVCVLLYIQCNRGLTESFKALIPGSTPNSSSFLNSSSSKFDRRYADIPNSSVVRSQSSSNNIDSNYNAPGPQENIMSNGNGDSSCGSAGFVSSNLLPKDNQVIDDSAFDFAPKDLQNINFLDASTRIGVDTVSSSLRNANYQIRSEPANPRDPVSPWMNSTIDPDLERRALET